MVNFKFSNFILLFIIVVFSCSFRGAILPNKIFITIINKNKVCSPRKEIIVLKKYMNNSRYKRWCIHSIWGKALRDGAVSMAESTWYRYAGKLGYSQKRKPKKTAPEKDHSTHPVRMKPGIWIFRNTRLWIMLSFISIQWWIILYSIADSKQLYNNYVYIILFASIFDLVNIGNRDSPI